MKISIFKEDLNNTSFYIYGYCGELYRMTFHEIYPKSAKKSIFFAPVKHILLLLPHVAELKRKETANLKPDIDVIIAK